MYIDLRDNNHKKKYILCFESSFDDTCCALVDTNLNVVNNVWIEQYHLYKNFKGMIPWFSSLIHIKSIYRAFIQTMHQYVEGDHIDMNHIDHIAVTQGPGSPGSLGVGIFFGYGLSKKYKKPIRWINHLVGHISSIFLNNIQLFDDIYDDINVVLLVSGGHTLMYLLKRKKLLKLGSTIDDALGECYDKIARMLELPKACGSELDKLAQKDHMTYFKLPIVRTNIFNFSFSGFKTYIRYHLRSLWWRFNIYQIASSIQSHIMQYVIDKLIRCASIYKANNIIIVGGCASNSFLWKWLSKWSDTFHIIIPPIKYCVDNAAMIGAASWLFDNYHGEKLDIKPNNWI